MTNAPLKAGDFTSLAEAYSQYRPGYAPAVVRAAIGLVGKPAAEIVAADVGAGTGIWSRMLAQSVGKVIAVEPNAEMRRHGIANSAGHRVEFREGAGESTGLADGAVDLLTMASSFHWVDFERGLAEFHRALRTGGWFIALWNPRVVTTHPLLKEIEAQIKVLNPEISRVSSGNSAFTDTLSERLRQHRLFDDVTYIEGTHFERQSREHYLGLWQSVNDVRVQLGPENWAKFISFVEQKTQGIPHFDVEYRTRAWAVRRRD